MTTEVQFYLERDNTALMTLTQNGIAADLDAITKVEFLYPDGSIDNITNPELFTFESTGIRLKFGALNLVAGEYDMQLVIYSADHLNGILWDSSVRIGLVNDYGTVPSA